MNSDKNNNPCRYYEDRHATCHGKCEKYQTWSKERQEYCSKIHKELLKEIDVCRPAREAKTRKLKKLKNKTN